jgi:hypothetical protein
MIITSFSLYSSNMLGAEVDCYDAPMFSRHRWLSSSPYKLLVPCRLGIPHIGFKLRQGAGRAFMHCHVPCIFGLRLPTEVSSALSHVLWPRTSPSCRGGLRRCHVSRGLEPRLLTEVSSGAATCPSAPDLASLLR